MKPYPREKPRKRDAAQQHNDMLDAKVIDAAAAAVVEQLKRTLEINPARAICNLGPIEVRHIAIGCISAYVKARAEAEKVDAELDDSIGDLFA